MIRIHQAIYGDVNGAYELISSSFPDKAVPKRLANATDLIDRPQDGVLDAPILRGFSKDGYFLFIKTFPDLSEGVRRGRVFSHVLNITQDDFIKIKDLPALAKYHLGTIDKSYPTTEIEIKNENLQEHQTEAANTQVISAINGLVQHVEYDNTVVMIGKDNYFEWLTRLWQGLPAKMKKILKIGAAFNPKKIDSTKLNILYIPVGLRQNWTNTTFKIIDVHQTEELKSQTAHYLSGDLELAKNLNGILTDYQPKIEEIDDLLQFEKMIPAYIALKKKKKPTIKGLVIFADLISKYNPDPKSKPESKKSLLDGLVSLLNKAGPKEIRMVANPDWAGFQTAESSLSKELTTWSYNNILNASSEETAKLLLLAHNDAQPNWWGKSIKVGLVRRLSKWNLKYAKAIWRWLRAEEKLIGHIMPLVQGEVQEDFINSYKKSSKGSIDNILKMANQKKWFKLHGLICVKHFSAKEALQRQLKIDKNQEHQEALKLMAVKLGGKKFVLAAVDIGEKRILKIAGDCINENSKLLAMVDVIQPEWQKVWKNAIDSGAPVWSGIKDAKKTLFQILDIIKSEGGFDSELLAHISISNLSSLMTYPERKQIWDNLPNPAKKNFINVTANECLDSLAKENGSLDDIERELADHLQKSEQLNQAIRNSAFSTAFKMKLLNWSTSAGQAEYVAFVKHCSFSSEESKHLGTKVLANNWKRVADQIYNLRYSRKDLKPAFVECLGIFGVFKRLALKIEGFGDQAISDNEWWGLLAERASQLFPYGPDQNGIWERAGGENSNLLAHGTGKEKWHAGVQKVRISSFPNAGHLIGIMLEEFPKDDILIQLKNSL